MKAELLHFSWINRAWREIRMNNLKNQFLHETKDKIYNVFNLYVDPFDFCIFSLCCSKEETLEEFILMIINNNND